MPTYNNGSNSNLDSDGKCALVFMPVEAMEAPQALSPDKSRSYNIGKKS